jgi:hypothetical protein
MRSMLAKMLFWPFSNIFARVFGDNEFAETSVLGTHFAI